jgi:tRNA modification GTPase TrmE
MNDTIAAISTALGIGAISIIRVSGKEAIAIVSKIWDGKDLSKQPSHTINYGKIVDNEEIIDEVLLSIMLAPKTFTTEDVIEINSHGGIATTNRILELLLVNGCRLAEPGEFTKRAFLNGRIDLIEAEGIMDLISAKTDKSRALALNQMSGNVSTMINELRKKIVEVVANIEVNIDYPEYKDIEVMTIEQVSNSVEYIEREIKKILSRAETGTLIKDGIKTVIVGKPNVGKSSILNKLLEEEKAIVTDIAGTTRDIVEGDISIGGIILHMIDTAGIRETNDLVESIGVKKSLDLIESAELVLFVLNNNEEIIDEEIEILNKIGDKPAIIIVNKNDLPTNLNELKTDKPIIYMSTINNNGVDELRNKIKELFNLEQLERDDYTYLSSARSISLLKLANTSLNEVKKGIEQKTPIDMIEIDLKNVWSLLGEITGETYSEELIDQLFSQFCLGK